MPKWLVIGIVTLVVLVILGAIARETIYMVDENKYAVVLQFQKIKFVKTDPGLKFQAPLCPKCASSGQTGPHQ